MTPLRIGSRGSQLALKQVSFVESYIKECGHPYVVQVIKTSGDEIQDRPLYDIGGKALFSKEIERAILGDAVDVGVHSLKDLETPRPKGLTLFAFLPRADARDVLITRVDWASKKLYGSPILDLPKNATIGSSSPRRMAQILLKRPDLNLMNIRGNVETRLQKVGKACDAVILAKAGLDRLGFSMEESCCIPIADMVPSAGQGIIVLECRGDDMNTQALLKGLNDASAQKAALIERGVIEKLNASCRSAVGVYADIHGDEIVVHVFVQHEKIVSIAREFSAAMGVEEVVDAVALEIPSFF